MLIDSGVNVDHPLLFCFAANRDADRETVLALDGGASPTASAAGGGGGALKGFSPLPRVGGRGRRGEWERDGEGEGVLPLRFLFRLLHPRSSRSVEPASVRSSGTSREIASEYRKGEYDVRSVESSVV